MLSGRPFWSAFPFGDGTRSLISLIVKVNAMLGGTHVAVLSTGQRLQVSRLQSKILRERFLRL
jgi:hypothetical protein